MASMEDTEQKTHKENNPQTNFQNINSSENSYSNSSELKSVTLAYSNPNFNSPSFSKLLEGVVMAANSSLSRDPLVKTVGFEGKFEMSHQEALANVTAKATQNWNSCHSDEPPGDVPRTPKSDGYNWRKYGQKQVKGSRSSRSYYRCTSFLCRAKKTVQHLDSSGEVIDVVYKGDHNHDPPQNPRGTSRKKDSTQRAVQSDLFVNDLNAHHSLASEGEPEPLVVSTYACQDKNLIGETGTSTKDVEEQHSKSVDAVLRYESELAIVPAVEERSSPRSENPTEVAKIDPIKLLDVAPVKKRRIKERGKACSESVYRTFKDPKVVVLADADVGMSSDGYRWRKYGQKMVKGTPHPRSYYRCSSVGCPVRKHVERATENSTTILVTYEGEHDHDIPTPKRHHQISSPNFMASDANTVSEKSENKSPSGSAEEQSKDSDSNLGDDQKGSETGGDKVLESARTLLSIGIELKSC